MCEYCGCQALATIDELTREHDLVVDLIGRGARRRRRRRPRPDGGPRPPDRPRAGPAHRGRGARAVPGLAADFPDHIGTLRAEHRRVEAVLGEARSGTPADPASPARLAAAIRILREHIIKEQDGVFPAALASLRAADWEAAEAVRLRVGSLLPSAAG